MTQLEPGVVIAEKFRLVSLLGRGGMGSVWLAENLTLRSEVAIKFIEPSIIDHPVSLRRFRQEAESAARLRSAHVVQVFDYGIQDELPYIVMERLVGESLREKLEREGTLTPAETMHIVGQTCRALERAHETGLVHRDIKPDNVFLTNEGAETFIKVLDFGIAKAVDPDAPPRSRQNTETGTLLGSPQYMSPEQAHGAKDVDARTDLWSLAVLTFECLTGFQPFRGSGWGELVIKICRDPIPRPSDLGQVPVGFDEWFEKATQRDVSERFATASDFARALGAVLTPEGAELQLTPPPSFSDVPGSVLPTAPSDRPGSSAVTSGARVAQSASEIGQESGSFGSTTAGVAATDPPRPRSSGRLVIGLAAMIALGVVGALVWSGGSSAEQTTVSDPPARDALSGHASQGPVAAEITAPTEAETTTPPERDLPVSLPTDTLVSEVNGATPTLAVSAAASAQRSEGTEAQQHAPAPKPKKKKPASELARPSSAPTSSAAHQENSKHAADPATKPIEDVMNRRH